MSDEELALFGHWICPYVSRVQFALHQRRIPYTLIDVPPTAARPRGYVVPPEFVAHSPRGEVPLVRLGQEYRADSLPILAWLEERLEAPSLLPPERAELVWARAHALDRELYAAMIGVYYGTDPGRIAAASEAVSASLATLAGWLEEGPYLAGPAPTLADAVAAPFFVRRGGLEELGLTAVLPPAVAAYEARLAALDGGRAVAWSPAQTAEFVDRFERYRARRAVGR